MKKIILIIVIAVGATYHFKPEVFSFNIGSGAFDDQGKPLTLVFTHPQCKSPCDDAIKLLNKRRIQYTEYPQDGSQENKAMWKQYSGTNRYPYIVVGDERVMNSDKTMIVSKLAMAYGDSVLTKSERFYMRKHFYDDGKPKLVMYGADWCPHCKKLREELIKNKIDYVEIDVEKSSWGKSIINTLEIRGYPTVYYGFDRLGSPDPKDVVAMF